MINRPLLFTVLLACIVPMRSLLSNEFSKFDKVRLDKRSFEAVKNLHMNWYINAVKALMGQLGKQLYDDLETDDRKRLASCLNDIDDKSDLTSAAKCLIEARNLAKEMRKTAYNDFIYNIKSISQFQGKDADSSAAHSAFVTEPPTLTIPPSANSSSTPALRIPVVSSSYETQLSSSLHATTNSIPALNDRFILLIKPSTSQETQVFATGTDMDDCHGSNGPVTSAEASMGSVPNVTMKRKLVKNNVTRSFNAESGLVKYSRKLSARTELVQLFNSDKKRVMRQMKAIEMQVDLFDNKRSSKGRKLKGPKRQFAIQGHYPVIYFTNNSRIRNKKQDGRAWREFKRLRRRRADHKRKNGRFEFFRQRHRRSVHMVIDDDEGRHETHKIQVKNMDRTPKLVDPVSKSLAQRVVHLIRSAVHGNETFKSGEWSKAYKKLLQFKNALEEKKKLPGARVYERRLYDIVIDSKHPTSSPKRMKQIPDILVSAYNLIDSLGGKHAQKGSTNFKFLSPRFVPLMPDKIETQSRYLSPSFLSFYKDDSPDNIAALPKILEDGGMEEKDREAVIEAVMDVSGAKDAVNMGLDLLSSLNFTGIEGELLEVTSRLDKAFKELERNFNGEQRREIEKNGFSFLEAHQLRQLTKSYGVHKAEEVGFDTVEYENMTKAERQRSLWKAIEQIAENKTSTHERHKRQVAVLAPLVLAPFIFSPIVGLSVLGPVVLSPSIFSVLLLNPSVLGPFVLSPAFFLPFIISPYVLSPYVLSPIFAAPFVLNPYVLSPNVINPYVLSPLILSPYVLCPDVYSPQALGGPILSPGVFSPAIMTDSILMASVLSPTFMS